MKVEIRKLEDMTPEDRERHLREQQEIRDRLDEGETLDEIFANAKKVDENIEEFRNEAPAEPTIVIPEDVAFDMRSKGIDPLEVAEMIAKKMRKVQ